MFFIDGRNDHHAHGRPAQELGVRLDERHHWRPAALSTSNFSAYFGDSASEVNDGTKFALSSEQLSGQNDAAKAWKRLAIVIVEIAKWVLA